MFERVVVANRGAAAARIIRALNGLGVKSVAVTFGYAHVPVDELGADALIDHFRDLPDALRKIASAPVKT